MDGVPEVGRWNGHRFEVSPTLIRGFTGLTITGSSETEDKVSNNQKYVSRLNGMPTAISLTVLLNAYLGCNVREEAMAFIADATAGEKDYFYIGGKKLVTCALMLTEASVEETEITAGGDWASCKVKLTLKQCAKEGTSSSSSASSSAGTTAKKESTGGTSWVSKAINYAKDAIANSTQAEQDKDAAARAKINRVRSGVEAAQKESAKTKGTSGGGIVGDMKITRIAME